MTSSVGSLFKRPSHLVSYALMLGGWGMMTISGFFLESVFLATLGLAIGVIGFFHYWYVFKKKLSKTEPERQKNPWESSGNGGDEKKKGVIH